MKRIFLFLITNIAILFTLSIVANLACAFFGASLSELIGTEYSTLAIFSLVYGFLGAIISLLISKPMAKFTTGAVVIDGSEGSAQRWLYAEVEALARRAGIRMPEVAIYHGSANAFATGAFKNSALVAVSDQIMEQMTKDELRAVLAHEISHVANGDMVTLTLVQGILNSFVIFFSRIIAKVISSNGNGDNRRSDGVTYTLLVMLLQIVLGIFASLIVFWFSRRREYAADAGSAKLLCSPSPMISALRRLSNLQPGVLPDSIKAMGIVEGKKTSIWSTHPSLDDRIEALQNLDSSNMV
jgi:heat shock protein HtpX